LTDSYETWLVVMKLDCWRVPKYVYSTIK